MLVVLGRAPADREAVARAARAVGLPPVDLRMRAQGLLPKVIHTDADAERARRLVEALVAEGAGAFLLDPAAIGRAPRLYARSLAWTEEGFAAIDGLGRPHPCPFAAIRLVQKGRVTHTETNEVVRTEKKFAVGRAVLSGGLMVSKTVETKAIESREHRSALLLVQRNDGGEEIALSEGHVDFRFLGAEMAPTSMVNLDRTLAALRARHPTLPVDERAFQGPFLLGVPKVGPDPTELAFAMLAAAQAGEGRG